MDNPKMTTYRLAGVIAKKKTMSKSIDMKNYIKLVQGAMPSRRNTLLNEQSENDNVQADRRHREQNNWQNSTKWNRKMHQLSSGRNAISQKYVAHRAIRKWQRTAWQAASSTKQFNKWNVMKSTSGSDLFKSVMPSVRNISPNNQSDCDNVPSDRQHRQQNNCENRTKKKIEKCIRLVEDLMPFCRNRLLN